MTDKAFKTRLQAALAAYRKIPRPPLGRCMWWKSDCQQPVSSHSVSRAWLERLARGGHVLQFGARPNLAIPSLDVTAELIGINLASVFPGFCAEHDSNIFQSIDRPMTTCSRRQCDLLVFRSVCREAYTKYRVVSFNLSQGMVKDHPTRHGVSTVEMMFCCFDLLAEATGLEQCLDSGTSDYCHHVIEFSRTPIVAASTTFNPQVSFEGLSLQGGLEWLTISILPSTFGGLAVLSWRKARSAKATTLLDSLLRVKPEWLSDMLLRYVIDNAENAFYAPDWWDALSPEKQTYLVGRYKATLLNQHLDMKSPYATDGVPLVDWSPMKQYRIG